MNRQYSKQKPNKPKNFNDDYKGKKTGKAYFEYMAESKRKQELLIKQKLEECRSSQDGGNLHKVKLETRNPGTSNEYSYPAEKKMKLEENSNEHFYNNESTAKREKIESLNTSTNDRIKSESSVHSPRYEPSSLAKKCQKSTDDDSSEIKPPEDINTIIAIENLVSQITTLPQNMQMSYLKNFEDQEEYWFLTVSHALENKYFHWRLKQINDQKARQNDDNKLDENTRRRKSRWGKEANVPVTVSTFVKGSQPGLTEAQKMQVEYQKELQMMHEFINAQHKQKEQELMNSIEGVAYRQADLAKGKHKYEYDSDEDTDGGTWEHKLRIAEMEATKDWANKLNDMGQGKHHIGDFLPPDEFVKFMETFRALKEGRKPEAVDYKKFKITCENVGFKMLKKMGWKEGEGLGSDSQGITVPITSGAVKPSTSGIGIEQLSKLTKNDDEYDAYRKRMMLAYRFRPNPLNNPRRDYY